MLKIRVPMSESFDEETSEFVIDSFYDLELEHSLASLSKWEQKYEKPFLSDDEKSLDETFDYIKMMSIGEEPSDEVISKMTEENFDALGEYINGKQTATWFREDKTPAARREIITNEIIYYWMVSLNISMECEHWHLNRLITLIRVASEKNKPQKKMSKAELAARNRELNAKRRAELNNPG